MSDFSNAWYGLASEVYACSVRHGFHGNPNVENVPTKLMLIVSELSEAMEAHRKDEFAGRSNKIPEFSHFEEEIADSVIRTMDLGVMLKMRLPEAIEAKMKYNESRPHLHGNKLY